MADTDAVSTDPRAAVGPNELLAFVLELAALAFLCWWGFATGANVLMSIVLGIGAPVVAAVLWGLFAAAQRPRFSLPRPGVLAVKAVVFGGATAALVALGQPILAAVFAVVVVVNLVIAERRRMAENGPSQG